MEHKIFQREEGQILTLPEVADFMQGAFPEDYPEFDALVRQCGITEEAKRLVDSILGR